MHIRSPQGDWCLCAFLVQRIRSFHAFIVVMGMVLGALVPVVVHAAPLDEKVEKVGEGGLGFQMCRRTKKGRRRRPLRMRRRRRRRSRRRRRRRPDRENLRGALKPKEENYDEEGVKFVAKSTSDATWVGPRTIHNMTLGIRDTYTATFWLAPPLSFSWISVHPKNPKVAYLGTANGFLYRTTDGGHYWKETRLIVNQPKFFGSLRKGGAKLGVGIRGAALRMQAQMRAYWGRKAKAWEDYPYAYPYAMRRTSVKVVKSPLNITPGSINMKQYLVMRSGSMSRIPMRINHIGFDPNDDKVAFVATAYGGF